MSSRKCTLPHSTPDSPNPLREGANSKDRTSPSPSGGGGVRASGVPLSEGADAVGGVWEGGVEVLGGNSGGGLQLILAVAMCTFGCALLTAGIAIPPAGILDNSLLIAFGEILTFAGSLIGIDYKYRYRGN